MTTRNLTLCAPDDPKHLYAETQCWTCQRPLMRRVRHDQSGRHYCSMSCWLAANALRQRDKLWAQVTPEGECWIWHGRTDRLGYGTFSRRKGHSGLVHRIVYILARGSIPDDCVLDHLCRRPPCVNPAHLEAVPQRVNVFRGRSHIAANRHKTHCPHGHAYTPENTAMTRNGARYCRQCNRNRWHKRTAKSRVLTRIEEGR
jgi:HNH endonuclease